MSEKNYAGCLPQIIGLVILGIIINSYGLKTVVNFLIDSFLIIFFGIPMVVGAIWMLFFNRENKKEVIKTQESTSGLSTYKNITHNRFDNNPIGVINIQTVSIETYLDFFELIKYLPFNSFEDNYHSLDMFAVNSLNEIKERIYGTKEFNFFVSIDNCTDKAKNSDEKIHELKCYSSDLFFKKCIDLKLMYSEVYMGLDTYFKAIPNTFFEKLKEKDTYRYEHNIKILERISFLGFTFFKKITDYYDCNPNFSEFTKINMIFNEK